MGDRRSFFATPAGIVAVLLSAALAVGGLVFALGLGTGVGRGLASTADSPSEIPIDTAKGGAPQVGVLAPAIEAMDLEGKPISLTDYRGRPLWLVFNATWCSACRAEIPDIQAEYDKGEVQVLAFYKGEEAGTVRTFNARLGVGYPSVPDADSSISAQYRVMGVPTHFFIDGDGIIQHRHTGVLSPRQIEAFIKDLS
ncbi:MAG: TlpA disulfide reductase family protein [Actinomycetaceae bacterium]|nr:TlpA disulfide reductase family protein [Actinomycetaceae bacterium]